MRTRLVVVGVVILLGLAGCVEDPGTDDGLEADRPGDGGGDGVGDVGGGDTGAANGGDGDGNSGDGDPVVGDLRIHHIDVGQADATLLVAPGGETMLVDSGDWRQDGQGVIDYLDATGIDRIDHLVATHGHADHIGGHAAVIEHIEEHGEGIGAAYDSGVAHTSQTYTNYLDAIEAYEVDLYEVVEGDEIPFGESVDVTVLNPPAGDSGTDLHYNSVTLAIEFEDFRYLTTGDAETDAEQRLVEEWADELPAGLYQAGHHGSSTSSTEPFLAEVEPAMAVISSDLDSQYGHPHDEILTRFADRDIETYWTGVHGEIVVTTDGTETTVTTTVDASTDPLDLLAKKHGDQQSTLAVGPTLGTVDGPSAVVEPTAEATGSSGSSILGPTAGPGIQGGAVSPPASIVATALP